MDSYTEHVEFVTREILQVFCGMSADPIDPRARAVVGDDTCRVTISFTGAFTGDLVLECSSAFAHTATARTMGTSVQALTSSEIGDVLKEFVNMAAGNLKAVFPRPTTFSFPAEGPPASMAGTTLVGESVLESGGEPIRVTLHRRHQAT
jgi:CheY-specific phosphatase CheX